MSTDSNKAKLEYILPSQIKPVKTESIEKKKGGFIQPPSEEELKNQFDFYDEVNSKKSKTWDHVTKISKQNPFVPLGALVTLVVLGKGVMAMKNRDTKVSQQMMRYRVVAQGATIIALVVGTLGTQYYSKFKGES
jgi:hypothetical protein